MAGNYEKRGNSYRLSYMFKGQKHTRTIKLTKGKKIELELSKFVLEIQESKTINKTISFTDFAQKWLDEYARPNLTERTVQGYIDYLNLRLIPYFGYMKLSEIELYNVQTFINSLKTSLSSETIKKYKNCLSGIYNLAIKWGFAKYNPCIGVDIPKGLNTTIESVFMTQDEVNILLKKIQAEEIRYQIIVKLALQCGMRRSEILGLEWKGIDFQNCTISIYQTISAIKGKGAVISGTKNKSSIRIVYAKQDIFDLIKQLPHNCELIFGYMHPDTVTQWFRKFLIKNDLKLMRFHDLRHTHATLLIANNVNIKTVSARLGHSNISTTLNRYTHPLSEEDKKASLLI